MAEQPIQQGIEYGNFLLAIASGILGSVAIILALGGIFAFLNIRHIAKATAEAEARETAESIAEKAATTYLEAEIPAIMAAYSALGQSAVNDEIADQIAENQDEGR